MGLVYESRLIRTSHASPLYRVACKQMSKWNHDRRVFLSRQDANPRRSEEVRGSVRSQLECLSYAMDGSRHRCFGLAECRRKEISLPAQESLSVIRHTI